MKHTLNTMDQIFYFYSEVNKQIWLIDSNKIDPQNSNIKNRLSHLFVIYYWSSQKFILNREHKLVEFIMALACIFYMFPRTETNFPKIFYIKSDDFF